MIPQTAPIAATGPTDVLAALRVASRKTGLDFDYLLHTAMRESNLNNQAKSKSSSASGLFQFIDQTWLGLVKQFGERYGLGAYAGAIQQTADGKYTVASADTKAAILALRQDPQVSACMAGENAKQTKQSLECALGREICGGELYAAHFLGPSGARRLIQLNETDPSSRADLAFPQAAKVNRSMFYRTDGTSKTVAELYSVIVNQPSQTPRHMPSLPVTAPPAPVLAAANSIVQQAGEVMSAFAEPLPSATPALGSSNAIGESQPASAGFYRTWRETTGAQTPVQIQSLPQPPMILSPDVIEIIASLSPLNSGASA